MSADLESKLISNFKANINGTDTQMSGWKEESYVNILVGSKYRQILQKRKEPQLPTKLTFPRCHFRKTLGHCFGWKCVL